MNRRRKHFNRALTEVDVQVAEGQRSLIERTEDVGNRKENHLLALYLEKQNYLLAASAILARNEFKSVKIH